MKSFTIGILGFFTIAFPSGGEIKSIRDLFPGKIESIVYLAESGYWDDSAEATFKFEDKSVSPNLVAQFENEPIKVKPETELKGLCGCEGSYTIEKLEVRTKSGKAISIIINECGVHGYKKGIIEVKKKRYDVDLGEEVEAILSPIANGKRKSILSFCGG